MWKAISLSLDEETIKLLKETSKKTDVPMSKLVKRALWEVYGEKENEAVL